MSDDELAFASIQEVGRLYRQRKVSPVEITNLILARIERLNAKLNAYITVTPDFAVAQAKKAEAELLGKRGRKTANDRGPLHGIPISLKDNICTAGIRTTAGSKILKDFVPHEDAVAWSRLKEGGAILVGKTNLHEFAYGVTTNNPHYGPARNPWDLNRIPGGSSGGSAAAVAAGLCYASIGTDTGGSIRIPAALCGVVGLKPGVNCVSAQGVVPLSITLDFVGPLARNLPDIALIFAAIRERPARVRPEKSRERRKFTVGLPSEFYFDVIGDDVRATFDKAVQRLEKAGHTIKKVSMPLLPETEEAGNHIAWPEATHYHQQSGWFPSLADQYGEDVRSRLEMGTRVSAMEYLKAMETRKRFIHQLDAVFANARIDALITPTTSITAPLIGEESTQINGKQHLTRALLLRLNRPANLSGSPAISFPYGKSADGLPVGIQLIGNRGAESMILSIAKISAGEVGSIGAADRMIGASSGPPVK